MKLLLPTECIVEDVKNQKMIKWYDYIIAIAFADLLLTIAVVVPFIGFIVAYAVYEYGWDFYCNWRYEQEHG